MAFSLSGSGSNSGSGRGSIFGSRRFGGSHPSLAEMNVVPLVDVVLVLLVIFMLTASVMEFGLEIEVPKVQQVRDTAEELPQLSINSKGEIFFDGKPININKIAEQVHAKYKDAKEVYLSADKSTIFDPIAQVMSTLSEAKLGIKVVVKPIDSGTQRR